LNFQITLSVEGRSIFLLNTRIQPLARLSLMSFMLSDQAPFFQSGNLTVPADQFHAIGSFDPTFTISEAGICVAAGCPMILG